MPVIFWISLIGGLAFIVMAFKCKSSSDGIFLAMLAGVCLATALFTDLDSPLGRACPQDRMVDGVIYRVIECVEYKDEPYVIGTELNKDDVRFYKTHVFMTPGHYRAVKKGEVVILQNACCDPTVMESLGAVLINSSPEFPRCVDSPTTRPITDLHYCEWKPDLLRTDE